MQLNFKITSTGRSYSRSSPLLYNETYIDVGFENYFKSTIKENTTDSPDEGYYILENAYVYENKYIFSDGDFLPLSTVDFPQAINLKVNVKERITNLKYRVSPTTDRTDIIFCKAGAGNYGHFLAECAPKLINLSLAKLGAVRLHIPSESAIYSSLLSDICQHLSIDADIRVGTSDELVFYGRIIFLSAVSRHNNRKSRTLIDFRDVIFDRYKVRQSYANKLAIVRSGFDTRKIANGYELTNFLRLNEFQIFNPSIFTVKEQIIRFASASTIFGSLGAGFTNTIWAGSQCNCVMVDPGLADFFFWDAAALFGQKFHWYFAGTIQPWNAELERADYNVNPIELAALLDAIG